MKLYTTTQASKILGLTDRHYVWKQIKRGAFGNVERVSERYMLTKPQIIAYAEARGRDYDFGVLT